MYKVVKFVKGNMVGENNNVLYCPYNNKPCTSNCALMNKELGRNFYEGFVLVTCGNNLIGKMSKEE